MAEHGLALPVLHDPAPHWAQFSVGDLAPGDDEPHPGLQVWEEHATFPVTAVY